MKKNQKREQIFSCIQSYVQKNGFPPSVREICALLGITSTATVAYNIEKLKEEGRLQKQGFKNRAISISAPKESEKFSAVPLVGKVAAGMPILATEMIEETYSIPKNLFRGDELFMLNVSGNSMIDAGIFDGDKIVVRKQSTANRGQIVVALVGDEATVKRFYPEHGHIRLQPENPTMEPIIVPNCDILGVVVGSIRNF